MSKKTWFYIGFFALLVTGFYFTLISLVPNFGRRELPVLSYVQPFFFTNQDGKMISEKDVQGKVFVAEYFFTTCKGICPKMNRNMYEVYNKFKDNPDFKILSHTVDPAVDDVPRLKQYAKSIRAHASFTPNPSSTSPPIQIIQRKRLLPKLTGSRSFRRGT